MRCPCRDQELKAPERRQKVDLSACLSGCDAPSAIYRYFPPGKTCFEWNHLTSANSSLHVTAMVAGFDAFLTLPTVAILP